MFFLLINEFYLFIFESMQQKGQQTEKVTIDFYLPIDRERYDTMIYKG